MPLLRSEAPILASRQRVVVSGEVVVIVSDEGSELDIRLRFRLLWLCRGVVRSMCSGPGAAW